MTADRDKGLLSQEIDALLLHARGLVLVRRLLAERGASHAELEEHTRELERIQRRLADMVRGDAGLLREPALTGEPGLEAA